MRGLRIGVTMPVLVNFTQAIPALHSIRSKYNIEIKVMDQWRDQKPLSRAWNMGADYLFERECDYVLVINDDILLSPDALDHLVQELVEPRDPSIILVSSCNVAGAFDHPDSILDHHDTFDGSTIADHPDFSSFLIGSDFFNKVGTFDENFYPAWFEDNDMHRRIELLGYRAICTTAASAYHFARQTSRILGHADSDLSKTYYTYKWGDISPNEIYVHPYNDESLSPRDWIQQGVGAQSIMSQWTPVE